MPHNSDSNPPDTIDEEFFGDAMDFFLNSLRPIQVTRLEQLIRRPDRAARLAERAFAMRTDILKN